MTTITFTDLQLKVTLTQWRKAQMPQWGERDWKMHLHDECVRYLNGNGKAKVFGVTIEDLADRGMTEWDKAGVATAKGSSWETGSTEPLPVASAAPADPYEPVGTMPVVGDKIVACAPGYPVSSVYTALELCTNYPEVDGPVMRAEVNGFKQFFASFTAGSHWRILKRQAAPAPATAGLQVWRDWNSGATYVCKDYVSIAGRTPSTQWAKFAGFAVSLALTMHRLPAAEEAREIEAAREAGVL